MDPEGMLYEVVDWAYLPQDRDQCLAVVNTKNNFSK
jgi:hypothetical protein